MGLSAPRRWIHHEPVVPLNRSYKTLHDPFETPVRGVFLVKKMLKHAYVCTEAVCKDFLDAPEASLRAASYGLERHGQNAHVQTYTCAQ